MKIVPNKRFFRRMERWLVGLAMTALAYLLEQAVLRSIRSAGAKSPSLGRPSHANPDSMDQG